MRNSIVKGGSLFFSLNRTNGIWQRLGLGYIYAANDIKAFNTNYQGDGEIYAKGKYKLHTINASYLIPNVDGYG
ncbi:carbohydrate porin [Gilliamella apicola]|uniref:carbohydrate porin n=1 Tax=Gilliamella apicola TaxID=1196095 RepID=UPI001C64D043|nr:carbohydrate porin [Gilliamella apicola]